MGRLSHAPLPKADQRLTVRGDTMRSVLAALGHLTKPVCAASAAAGLAFSLGAASSVRAEVGPTTHLLAIGICPPWKPQPQEVCEQGVAAIAAALQARLGIADENVLSLVNSGATAEGLRKGVAQLQDLGPSDRLIIFANLHAGARIPGTMANADNDVFVLWTEEEPAAMPFALARGDWITASVFAGMIHSIPAGEIVMILDACESDAVSSLFVAAHPDNDHVRPEAVITSSRADQFANFNADVTMALFTQELAQALHSTEGSLLNAAEDAASRTAAAAIPICDAMSEQVIEDGFDPLSCRQQPVIHDPDELLHGMALSG